MNPLIAMGYNPPDPVAAYAAGVEAKGIVDDRRNQNALRSFMQENGGAVMAGDQNALAQYAGFDPQGAMGIQQAQLGMEATRQGMAIDRERLGMARQQAALQAAQAARQMSAQEAAQSAAELERIGGAATVAYQQGPEAFQGFMAQYADMIPEEFKGINYENAPYAIAMVTGLTEGFQQEALKPTSGMQEYEFARSQGFPGSFEDWKARQTPKTEIVNNMGEAARTGTIPPGYAAVDDPNSPAGIRFEPIPGGPVAAEAAQADQKAALTSAKNDVSTQIVTTAAKEARDRIRGGITGTTGLPGQVMGNIDQTDAGILRSQIETLTAVAKIGNLQAMRAASPTGGALGAVSDKENQMLAAASGALNPNAPADVFAKQLDNYELTLLQVIHGPEAGMAIFEATRDRPSQKSRKIEMDGYTIEALD